MTSPISLRGRRGNLPVQEAVWCVTSSRIFPFPAVLSRGHVQLVATFERRCLSSAGRLNDGHYIRSRSEFSIFPAREAESEVMCVAYRSVGSPRLAAALLSRMAIISVHLSLRTCVVPHYIVPFSFLGVPFGMMGTVHRTLIDHPVPALRRLQFCVAF